MRKFAACLLLTCHMLAGGCAQAAAEPETGMAGSKSQSFGPAQQDYYLFKALLASDSAQRPRLHHIGALYEEQDGVWHIRNLLEGYPASQAGLRRGDQLLLADGEPFHPIHSFNNVSFTDAEISGQGTASTPRRIELTIRRNDQERVLQIPTVHENLYDAYRNATQRSVSMYPNGNKLVCYVHWWLASRSLADLIADRQLFRSLHGCDGLVLDLRDAFSLFDWQHLDHFFGSRRSYPELTLQTIGAMDGDDSNAASRIRDHLAPSAGTPERYFGRPMVVLVNEGTRGGMELLAWHLIRSGRAQSAGEPSAGLLPGTYILLDKADSIELRPVATIQLEHQPVEHAVPRIHQDWPLSWPGETDPQFDAALFALMGNI